MASAPARANAPVRSLIEGAEEPIRPMIAGGRIPIPGVRAVEPGSAETTADLIRPVDVGTATVFNLSPGERRGESPKAMLQTLQSWEGVVLDVSDTTFAVRLVDLTGDRPEEEMELEKEELSDFDLELLEPGAIFYWAVGYRRQLPSGARARVSLIRFRRLPAWSRAELKSARERAAETARELGW